MSLYWIGAALTAVFLGKVYVVDEQIKKHEILSAVFSTILLVAIWPVSALIFLAVVISDVKND